MSPHQLSYVTSSGVGEGLLFYGNVILPFTDKFPKNTQLYSIMTTKLIEIKKQYIATRYGKGARTAQNTATAAK